MHRSVVIDILGHQYSIKTDGDERHIQHIADYVNAKSREVMEATQTVSTLDLVLKVAINLADELFMERAAKEAFFRAVEEESRQLVGQIASVLETPVSET
jgi:cell division protein ZapA (FtsZ GTPase activity inhibitor)